MSYTHLTQQERYVISHLRVAKFSIREIARRLNRHHATISRELKRARSRYPRAVYWYDWAQPLAAERTRQARHYRRQKNLRLIHYVEERLKRQWSPEEISERLRIDYASDENMRISHETIYRWVYLDAGVEGNLYQNLREKWGQIFILDKSASIFAYKACRSLSLSSCSRKRFLPWLTVL